MIRRSLFTLLLLAAATGGCSQQTPDTGPVDVSAIGALTPSPDPDRGPISPADALLIDATAEGLVTIDAAGQVEPALADRWIVTDDGLGYIFHLRDARWPDGRPITADEIMRRLRSARRPASRNALQPVLSAITEISAVIPQVVDIRLDRPMPGLLAVLARPELALRRGRGDGTGPYRIVTRQPTAVVLDPRIAHALPIATLRGLRAALAVVRFKHQRADLVTGGTIGSLPLVCAADLAGPTLRFDPVHGLYGLVVIGDGGALADQALRRTLMMGLDDEALIAQAELPGLTQATGLVAADAGDFTSPAKPDWLNQPAAQRRPLAMATIRAWTAEHGHAPEVSIVRPDAAGDRLMVNLLATQWQSLGVTVTLVAPGRPADLELIDEIAPIASAEWYLGHFTCKATIACSPVADASLAAAAQSKLHAALTGEAARLMAEEVPFFPLANPLRWSLVAPGLDGYRDNPLALHPLATLRARPAK